MLHPLIKPIDNNDPKQQISLLNQTIKHNLLLNKRINMRMRDILHLLLLLIPVLQLTFFLLKLVLILVLLVKQTRKLLHSIPLLSHALKIKHQFYSSILRIYYFLLSSTILHHLLTTEQLHQRVPDLLFPKNKKIIYI